MDLDFNRIEFHNKKAKKEEKVYMDIEILRSRLFFIEIYNDFSDIANYYIQQRDSNTLFYYLFDNFHGYLINQNLLDDKERKNPCKIGSIINFIQTNFNDAFFDIIRLNTVKRDLNNEYTRKDVLNYYLINPDELIKYILLGLSLEKLDERFQNNKRIVQTALNQSKENIPFVGKDLLKDKHFITKNIYLIDLVTDMNLKKDKDIVIALIENNNVSNPLVFNVKYYLELINTTKDGELDFFIKNVNCFISNIEDYEYLKNSKTIYFDRIFENISNSSIIKTTLFRKKLVLNNPELLNNVKYKDLIKDEKFFEKEMIPVLRKTDTKINYKLFEGTFMSERFYIEKYNDIIYDIWNTLFDYNDFRMMKFLFDNYDYPMSYFFYEDNNLNIQCHFSIKMFLVLLKTNLKYYKQMKIPTRYLLRSKDIQTLQYFIDRYYVKQTKHRYFADVIKNDDMVITCKRYLHFDDYLINKGFYFDWNTKQFEKISKEKFFGMVS